ncbi:hypothetical protein CI105_01670 [Candidatus Izimaplasma bacterium ZiA1]|uniref:ABC transporter ATP-binding protein/permease n=1 Tax=Candidatus Izimoplasma sp. ZiA1 TaxID=2024899 RepID=UPI000BAA4F28|nr:hypothetical protein CI105_01670 [Candidatus Izimaplasma bacterium ZiA1]
MSRGDIILRLVEVSRIYETKEGRKIVALDKVTTSFKRGEFVAVVGKSGSGKSTLINILGGLDTPDGGDYFLEGNNIVSINEGHWDAIRNEKIGFIFQEYHLIEYLSVYKNVEIALKYQTATNRKTKDAAIKDILTRVGIIDHMHKLPSQLSGGQRQRVAIARALVKDPAIILADEPTGALDHKTSENVIDLIKGLSKERLVLVVTHDRGIANEHATRIIELTEGKFTSDLIKEDIEQTYQNVYKKTKPNNLKFRDKLELTFRKIKSQVFRTIFTAMSLALAFSFTILFNGIERGVSGAYDNYFEALNKANSYAFSFVMNDDAMSRTEYENAVENLMQSFEFTFSDYGSEILPGFSIDVALNKETGGVEHVTNVPTRPDLFEEYKLRLLNVSESDRYPHSDLFVGESDYPYEADEIMVTSKFIRDYLGIGDDVMSLNDYVGNEIMMPTYNFTVSRGIYDVDDYLDLLVEDINGDIILESDVVEGEEFGVVRYLKINIPQYCYYYDDLSEYYQNECDQVIIDEKYSRIFNSVDEYIDYVDDFKLQVDEIDPNYFDILFRSGFIYYVVDEKENDGLIHPSGNRYLERVFQQVYDEANNEGVTYFKDGIFKEQVANTKMYIRGIVENDNESIIYMDQETYNKRFIPDSSVEVLEGYFSVNLESGIKNDFTPEDIAFIFFADPLNGVNSDVKSDFKIFRNEYIEQGETCSIFDVDNILNQSPILDQVDLLGDVFTVTDYSSCKVNTESYHYLQSIRLLFGIFFNVLMIISIVFFNILLQVILGERISEIGIYRSVGSTSKDIKVLFFYEVLLIIFLSAVMSIGFITFVDDYINNIFINVIGQDGGVISFAGMKLSVADGAGITRISLFNLGFYIVVVLVLLGYLSNRNVSKLANTKPIDILREVD